jgi:hypothetical protein
MTSGGSQLDSISKSVKIFKWPTSKNIFFVIFNIFYILFLIFKYKINILEVEVLLGLVILLANYRIPN